MGAYEIRKKIEKLQDRLIYDDLTDEERAEIEEEIDRLEKKLKALEEQERQKGKGFSL